MLCPGGLYTDLGGQGAGKQEESALEERSLVPPSCSGVSGLLKVVSRERFLALIEILPNIEGFRLLSVYVPAGAFVISWVDLFYWLGELREHRFFIQEDSEFVL